MKIDCNIFNVQHTNGVADICVLIVAAIAATELPLGTAAIGVVATAGDCCSIAPDTV